MSVRAKFRCNSITLTRSSRTHPDVLDALSREDVKSPNYQQIIDKATKIGVPASLAWDQPTVALNPVVANSESSDEDRSFWSATPNGEIRMTISNPDAAETFELGQNYYVDFSHASED